MKCQGKASASVAFKLTFKTIIQQVNLHLKPNKNSIKTQKKIKTTPLNLLSQETQFRSKALKITRQLSKSTNRILLTTSLLLFRTRLILEWLILDKIDSFNTLTKNLFGRSRSYSKPAAVCLNLSKIQSSPKVYILIDTNHLCKVNTPFLV